MKSDIISLLHISWLSVKQGSSNYLVYGTVVPIERWFSLAYYAEAFTQGLLPLVNLKKIFTPIFILVFCFQCIWGEKRNVGILAYSLESRECRSLLMPNGM